MARSLRSRVRPIAQYVSVEMTWWIHARSRRSGSEEIVYASLIAPTYARRSGRASGNPAARLAAQVDLDEQQVEDDRADDRARVRDAEERIEVAAVEALEQRQLHGDEQAQVDPQHDGGEGRGHGAQHPPLVR